MELLGDVGHVESRSVCLETMLLLVSVQYSYTVCAERTIGSKIDLDAPDDTPSGRGSSGSLFESVWR
jgi:hypothetical protein